MKIGPSFDIDWLYMFFVPEHCPNLNQTRTRVRVQVGIECPVQARLSGCQTRTGPDHGQHKPEDGNSGCSMSEPTISHASRKVPPSSSILFLGSGNLFHLGLEIGKCPRPRKATPRKRAGDNQGHSHRGLCMNLFTLDTGRHGQTPQPPNSMHAHAVTCIWRYTPTEPWRCSFLQASTSCSRPSRGSDRVYPLLQR